MNNMRKTIRKKRIGSVVVPLLFLIVVASILNADGPDFGDKNYTSFLNQFEETPQAAILYSLINADYQSVKPILEKSCFDCHSRFTEYPWYHKIPGIKGMIDGHIKEGREHLEFSDDFPFTGKENTLKLLGEIKEEIEEGEMPLFGYQLLHWGTAIEGAQQDSVFNWIDRSTQRILQYFQAERSRIPHGIASIDMDETEQFAYSNR